MRIIARPVIRFITVCLHYSIFVSGRPNIEVGALSDAELPTVAFEQPLPRSPNPRFNVFSNLLHRRQQQGDCQSGYISCASISAPDACCPSDTLCARDPANNVACCPVNFACTGSLGSSTSGGAQPTQTNGGGVITVTITSTAGVTQAPTMTTGPQQSFGLTAGVVANDYYPYPVIATSFPNAGTCSQAYTFCQIQSTSCYQSLAGNNAVTVSNGMGGGGVTQTGGGAANGNAQVAASASVICSSLSVRACYGLQEAACSAIPTTGGTPSIQVGHAIPRETGMARKEAMAFAGMVGAIGMIL